MVDRFGSYFLLGSYTQEIVDRVYTNLEGNGDLTIEEYNLADIESKEVYFTVGEDTVKLNENDGYTVKSSKNDAHYNVNVYTFNKAKFDKEGEYSLVVSTKDTEGNASDNVSKKAEAKFVIDRTNPEFAINNVENGGDYEAESVNAEIIFHDNIALGGAKVTINDETTEYTAKELADMNNQLSQDFSDGTYTIKVEVTDAAGNVTTGDELTFKVYKNAVEKALDIQTETGKRNWLFIILGGVLIIGLAAFFIILAKRKKDDEEKK
jgi:LPXTG-motif cell wall-anchored protein